MKRTIIFFSFIIPFIIIFSKQINAFSDEPQSNRVTPVVLAIEKVVPAVANIRTERLISQRHDDPFFGSRNELLERFFEEFFGQSQKQMVERPLGSGVIIDEEGYIVTNEHVVNRATKIKVRLSDGRDFEATMISSDPISDLAVLKINSPTPLPYAKMGTSKDLLIGETVVALGNPLGLENSVTTGVLSAKNRTITFGSEYGNIKYDGLIQTDALINPGNSGGPLINTKGEVIGINTAIFTAGGTAGNIGIGFAIPINVVKPVLKELKEKGVVTRGWLGVMIQKVTPEIAKSFNLAESEGALVGDVVKGSPADKVGIKRGDVIVEFDGKKIKNVEDLPKLVALVKPESKAEMVIIRDGTRKKFNVTVGTLKEEKEVAEAKPEEEMGLFVQNITPEIGQQFNLDSTEGVIIVDVNPGSPAFTSGARRGQIIIEVNRKEIKNLDDYKKVVKNIKGGDVVTLLIRDGKSTRYIGFTLPKE
ncbi:MAG: hypothetical protein A2Z57_13545 [Planctomycetes bacterium RIFCSPHIGHO2_12_39_6]|nr:MAG: hypothetical protein A2Z57_13545 [Planctomycetes bacterium RIFCSPHIGHO2_12_39_6]